MTIQSSGSHQNETLRDWKVAFLCTSIYLLIVGLQRTGPLLFVECIRRYNINRTQASTPFTVSILLCILLGPFVGHMGTRFQIRSIVLFGCALSVVGVTGNFWAEDIFSVIVFWGVIFGIGMNCSVSLLQELLNRHFYKHFSTVCGLYTSGASIGSTVIPYLTKFLLNMYGLSGTFLILGGLLFHTIPLAMSLPVYFKPKFLIPYSHDSIATIDKNSSQEVSNVCVLHNSQSISISANTVKSASQNLLKERGNIVNVDLNTTRQPKTGKSPVCSSFDIFLNPVFIAIAIAHSCNIGIITMMNIILVDYCLEKGMTSEEGVYMVMTASVADFLGRMGLGWIIDCGFVGTVKFLMFTFVSLGLSCLMFTRFKGFAPLVVCSIAYGMFNGAVASYSPKMVKISLMSKKEQWQ